MKHIFVLHDDEEDLDMIRKYLSFLGYKVEAACNGQEARNLFYREPDCGLLITKIKMPDLEDNDIAQYIRNSQKAQTPIVAIANAGDNIDPNLFNSVVMTPCKLKVLGETVSSLIPPVRWVKDFLKL
jgi:CheY-like chemotaxis protein